MEKCHKFNRQKLDYILTDLLPYEKGNHFTNRYLYEYLINNKKRINKLVKAILKTSKYFDSKWHSSPLRFKISKKGDSFREISLINPLGLIEAIVFIQIFENDIINISHNKQDFSSRKAHRINSLTYKKKNKQTVYYSDDPKSKKQLLISLESSGSYFKHYPSKTITELLNSRRFIYSLDKFDLMLKLDIQDCFPSLYTHSFKWLISNKVFDSKNLKNANSIYSNIDAFLQNLNGSKTNGIIVGPEISRLLAEFMFIHIDEQLIQVLQERNLKQNEDYTIYRFVDDYFIFTNNVYDQGIIKNEISNLLNNYQLKINESKVSKFENGDNLNSWYLEVLPIAAMIEQLFNNRVESIDSVISSIVSESGVNKEMLDHLFLQVAAAKEIPIFYKENNKNRKIKYVNLRGEVNEVIASSNESALISSYLLSTILKKIEEVKQDELIINMRISDFIAFILFTYTKKVSYASTQKVVRIFALLIDKDIQGIKEIIERNIERFEEHIFLKHTNDWIDLMLLFSNYQLNISNKIIEKIAGKIINEENPVNLATLCLFAESEHVDSYKILREVNSLIRTKIKMINWDDFFQDELSWWVFVFKSYPKLNRTLKQDINEKLDRIKSELKNISSDEGKRIILDFLLESKNHFIEWNFKKDNYYKSFYYYTKDRTVFNPDIIDQISVSR
jgi:hypothetical protein